jgi:hypothetical protein
MSEVKVETRKRSEAQRIRDALPGSEVARSQRGWLVALAMDDLELARLLRALQECLDKNAIPAVEVAVDENHYMMEARSR